MPLCLLITCSPEDPDASLGAQRCARRALAAGEEVQRVFFHAEGVRQAVCPEGRLRDGWAQLATAGVDLVACSSAAGRRDIPEDALGPGFRLGGLGQLVEAALEADRFLQYGPEVVPGDS